MQEPVVTLTSPLTATPPTLLSIVLQVVAIVILVMPLPLKPQMLLLPFRVEELRDIASRLCQVVLV